MSFPITCTACHKTFTISDEIYEKKVAGRVVTIKCKSCSQGIRVDGTKGTSAAAPAPAEPAAAPAAAAAPAGEALWAVDYPDGQDREFTTAEVIAELERGAVIGSTLVWRDGMGEWLEVHQVPELAGELGKIEAKKKAAALAAAKAAATAPVHKPRAPMPTVTGLAGLPGAGVAIRQRPGAAPATAPAPAPAPAELPKPRAQQPSAPALATPLPKPRAQQPSAPALATPLPKPRAQQPSAPALGTPLPKPRAQAPSDSDDATPIPQPRAKQPSAPVLPLPKLAAAPPPAPPPLAAPSPSAPLSPALVTPPLPFAAPPAPLPAPPPVPVFEATPPLPASVAKVVSRPPQVQPAFPMSASPMAALNTGPALVSDHATVEWPEAKKKTPLIIVGVLAVVAIAAGAIVMLGGKDEVPPPSAPITAVPGSPARPASTPSPAATPVAAQPGAETATGSDPVATAPDRGATPGAGFAELFAAGARKAESKGATVAPTSRFDPAATKVPLAQAATDAQACKQSGGPTGKVTVMVTFDPNGKVSSASITDPPFAGTATATCISSALKRATIAPFSGLPGTVSKTFSIL